MLLFLGRARRSQNGLMESCTCRRCHGRGGPPGDRSASQGGISLEGGQPGAGVSPEGGGQPAREGPALHCHVTVSCDGWDVTPTHPVCSTMLLTKNVKERRPRRDGRILD